jgi:hypothetical protein
VLSSTGRIQCMKDGVTLGSSWVWMSHLWLIEGVIDDINGLMITQEFDNSHVSIALLSTPYR